MKTAKQIIEELELEEHPEGGFFKEIYRSETSVFSPVICDERNAITSIYFLLLKGQVSRIHRVQHDEIWHFYMGDPLRLIELDSQLSRKEVLLGNHENTISAQHIIRGNHWQAAETTGEYSLVGCTVAPGFDFHDFNFLKKHDMAVFEEYHNDLLRFF